MTSDLFCQLFNPTTKYKFDKYKTDNKVKTWKRILNSFFQNTKRITDNPFREEDIVHYIEWNTGGFIKMVPYVIYPIDVHSGVPSYD